MKIMSQFLGEPLKEECQYFLDIMAGIAQSRTDGVEGRSSAAGAQCSQRIHEYQGACSCLITACYQGVFVHESSYIDDNVDGKNQNPYQPYSW